MEPGEVRDRVAAALAVRLGTTTERARVVGNATLATIQECGLLTLSSSDLAKVNQMAMDSLALNAHFATALSEIAALPPEDAGRASSIASNSILTAPKSPSDA